MQRTTRTLLSMRDTSPSTPPRHVVSHRLEQIGAALLLLCALAAVHFASTGDPSGGNTAHTGPQSAITSKQLSLSPTASPSVTTSTSTPAVGATPTTAVIAPGGAQPHTTATPSPTMTPSPTPTPIPLVITITCATMSIANGGDVCIHTLPGASIELTASYCNTQDGGNDYVYDVADDQGNYEWTWDLDTTCTPTATATIYVIAYLGHQIVPATEEVPVN